MAAALKAAGHEVHGLNLNLAWCFRDAIDFLEEMVQRALANFQPELIGIGGLSADFPFIRDALATLRCHAPNVPVVMGNGIITYDGAHIFKRLQPDFALTNDTESTLVMLAAYLEKGVGALGDIRNLHYWRDYRGGQAAFTGERQIKIPLEELPYPDYDVFSYEKQITLINMMATIPVVGHMHLRLRVFPISMGRSCPYACTFCVHWNNRTYQRRDIPNAIDELAHFYEKYQFNTLMIYDELFSIKKDRVHEFCDQARQLRDRDGFDFEWTCSIRIGTADTDMLRAMKSAGCSYVGFGVESGSDTVLRGMKKKLPPMR